MSVKVRTGSTNGRNRPTHWQDSYGGQRPIERDMTCPYCGRELTLFCQSKWVYRWGSVGLQKLLICRRDECRRSAKSDGWM